MMGSLFYMFTFKPSPSICGLFDAVVNPAVRFGKEGSVGAFKVKDFLSEEPAPVINLPAPPKPKLGHLFVAAAVCYSTFGSGLFINGLAFRLEIY